jgi:hypothetical protein
VSFLPRIVLLIWLGYLFKIRLEIELARKAGVEVHGLGLAKGVG